MTIRKILTFPDERLRIVAKPVTEFDDALKTLVDDMFETMYAADGAGLAATQINVHQRVLVIDLSRDRSDPLVWINPKIISRSGTTTIDDGCLSVPSVWAPVKRSAIVTFTYQDINGDSHEMTADNSTQLARAIQHEGDHLDGKLFIDHLSPLKRKMLIKKMKKAGTYR